MSQIEINIEDQVCIIKLNRPEVFNSFNKEMAFELQEILDNCKKNPAVRSILLTGVIGGSIAYLIGEHIVS